MVILLARAGGFGELKKKGECKMKVEIGVEKGRAIVRIDGKTNRYDISQISNELVGAERVTSVGIRNNDETIFDAAGGSAYYQYGAIVKFFCFSALTRGKEREMILDRIEEVKSWTKSTEYLVTFEL